MTVKDWIVFAFWALAVMLLLIGGFAIDIGHPDWNLFDLAVAAFLVGYIIRVFVRPSQ